MRVGRTRAVQTLVALMLLPLVSTVAMAQDKPDIDAAKRAFKAGQEFMKMERYPDAIIEFNKAYAITKDGLVMGQVALAYEKAGDYDAALSAIRVYREALPSGDRASVDALIEKYEALLAQGKGKRLVLPGEQGRDAAAGQPAQGDAGMPAPLKDPSEGAPQKRRLWTWVAAGTAAALGVSALVVGLSAKSKFDELDDRCGEGQSGVCAQGDVDSVKARAIATDVLWGAGLAAAATAVVLYFVEQPHGANAPERDDNLLEEEVEDDSLVKNLQVAPVAGSGVYGLAAQLSY